MATRFESPLQTLRLLRGAPLSVVYALFLAQQMKVGPVGAEWLERHTGYTDKPITQALALLEEYQIARRNGRYGWTLASGAAQLPLMSLELDGGPAECGFDPETRGASGAGDGNGEGSRNYSESENFRLPDSSSSSSLDSSSRTIDPLPQESRAAEPENFRLVLAELERWGIEEPRRSKIARMAGVTVALVRYHCKRCEKTGQAIWRIEHHWAAKAAEEAFEAEERARLDAVDVTARESPAEEGEEEPVEGAAVDALENALREAAGRAVFENWLRGARLRSTSGGAWVVSVANRLAAEQAEKVRGLVEARLGVRLVVEVG